MPLFPSDFKKFKHVSNDDKTVTLEHPQGHQIIIARKAIKGPMRDQLEALCSGGMVKKAEGGIIEEASRSGLLGSQRKVSQEISDEKQGAAKAQTVKNDGTDVRTPEQKAKAAEYDRTGKLPGYADGGTVLPEDPNDPEIINKLSNVPIPEGPASQPTDLDRAKELYNASTSSPFNAGHMGSKIPIPGAGGEQKFEGENAPTDFDPTKWQQAREQVSTEQAANAAQTAAEQQRIIAINQQRADAGLPPLPVPNVPVGPQPPGSMDQSQPMPQPSDLAAASQPKSDDMGLGQQQDMLNRGFGHELAGINALAKAQGDLGQQQAAVLASAQQASTDAKAAYQKHYDELNNERQALVQDVQNGQVDPEKFWDNHSKIASAIGMIIAGFNPTNSPNAAMAYLNKQMDMNLEAQKTNLATKRSLLSANMQQFGNLKDATEMTRIQQADLVQNQLQQAAAKASSPLAKAAALDAAGKVEKEYASKFQQFAMLRTLRGLAQNGGSPQAQEHMIAMISQIDPEKGKLYRDAYVPGVGLSSSLMPIPDAIRQKITDHEDMAKTIKDLQQFVNTHSTIVPGTPEYNVGQQKALVLQSAVREGKLGTVYREGEQPLLDKFVNNNPAGAMKMLKTVPQLKELLSSNERSNNVLKKQYGLPTHEEPQYKTVNGIKYMRGPDGKAVKVP